MVFIRRTIFIIVLLVLIFVFYRLFNPQGADSFLYKFTGINISQPVNHQDPDLSGGLLSGQVETRVLITGTLVTGAVQTGKTHTGALATNIIQTGSVNTGTQQSGAAISLVDNMEGFQEVLDNQTSANIVKGSTNYINPQYHFSISFPGSRDGYTIQIDTGKDIQAQFIFSYSDTDYFIIYVVKNSYYQAQQKTSLATLTYLAKDSNNTFLYRILQKSDNKAKAVPYIIKTFKLDNPIATPTNIISPIKTTKTPTTTTTTTKKTYYEDSNNLKSIFDNFVK